MNPFPLDPRPLSRLLYTVAAIGVAATLIAGVALWGLLGRAQAALDESLSLTADTLTALDASAGVAADSVEVLGTSLAALADTASSLEVAFDDGEVLLQDLAELVRSDVADSLTAVDDALPGLIRVAGTIDTTLSTLSRLPFGPTYDPEESFADALRVLDSSLDGLPERLREQADLVETAGGSLETAGDGVVELIRDLAAFEETLAETTVLLETYDATIEEGRTLVADTSGQLDSQIAFARVAVVLIGAAFLLLQAVPLQLAAQAAQEARDARGRQADAEVESLAP